MIVRLVALNFPLCTADHRPLEQPQCFNFLSIDPGRGWEGGGGLVSISCCGVARESGLSGEDLPGGEGMAGAGDP